MPQETEEAPFDNRSAPSTASAADPFWQPSVPFRRVDNDLQRLEARKATPVNPSQNRGSTGAYPNSLLTWVRQTIAPP